MGCQFSRKNNEKYFYNMKIQQVKNEQIKVGDIVLVGSFYIDSDENLCFTKHRMNNKESKIYLNQ